MITKKAKYNRRTSESTQSGDDTTFPRYLSSATALADSTSTSTVQQKVKKESSTKGEELNKKWYNFAATGNFQLTVEVLRLCTVRAYQGEATPPPNANQHNQPPPKWNILLREANEDTMGGFRAFTHQQTKKEARPFNPKKKQTFKPEPQKRNRVRVFFLW